MLVSLHELLKLDLVVVKFGCEVVVGTVEFFFEIRVGAPLLKRYEVF